MRNVVKGYGIDICEIDRIKSAVKKREDFLIRYFGYDELFYIRSLKNPAQTIAANFAGKEAFAKAIGTGIRGFRLQEVQVLRDEEGKPFLKLNGMAEEAAKRAGFSSFLVSLSHCKSYAVAGVIGIGGQDG